MIHAFFLLPMTQCMYSTIFVFFSPQAYVRLDQFYSMIQECEQDKLSLLAEKRAVENALEGSRVQVRFDHDPCTCDHRS